MKKATDSQIVEAYAKYKSVWGAAKDLGMCGQSVHERCVRMGLIEPWRFTDEEVEKIRAFYSSGFFCGDGRLREFSLSIGRTTTLVCRKAREFGLTKTNRKKDAHFSNMISIRTKKRIAEKGHPRGALGMKHSAETKIKVSLNSRRSWAAKTEQQKADKTMKMMKTKALRGNLVSERHKTTWKQGWRVIGGVNKYYRSRWEANYARYLELLRVNGNIASWEHEPETFWFENILRGCRSYLPDFRVTMPGGSVEYHEVKGWMDDRSKTKIKRMKKYHPNVKLVLICKKQYEELRRKLAGAIKDWE